MFPTGNSIDALDVPGVGTIEATLINAGNPTIFVDAARLGLTGTELQKRHQRQREDPGAGRSGALRTAPLRWAW